MLYKTVDTSKLICKICRIGKVMIILNLIKPMMVSIYPDSNATCCIYNAIDTPIQILYTHRLINQDHIFYSSHEADSPYHSLTNEGRYFRRRRCNRPRPNKCPDANY